MKNRNAKIKGIIVTVVFHLLVLGALIFFGLSTPLPLPGEEGVIVDLGYSDIGSGMEPESEKVSSTPPQPKKEEIKEKQQQIEEIIPEDTKEEPVVEKIEEEDILTQETEEAPSLVNPKEKEDLENIQDEKKEEPEIKEDEDKITEEKEKVEKQPEETDETEPKEEKTKQPEVNPKALYKGPTKKDGTGKSEGETKESGNQGSPLGDSESDNYEGKGGEGEGVEYDLGGRGAKHLPKPTYTSEEQGKVVVTIWVDRRGKVVKAISGVKGTTIADLQLRKVAKEAALGAKFNSDPEAPEIQKGTITYNFIKLR